LAAYLPIVSKKNFVISHFEAIIRLRIEFFNRVRRRRKMRRGKREKEKEKEDLSQEVNGGKGRNE